MDLSRTISEINALMHFMQKFKMATKRGGKAIFDKNRRFCIYPVGQNSRTVKEIEANLCIYIFGKKFENSKWPPFLERGIFFLKIGNSIL